MRCSETAKRLNAWVDGEVSSLESEKIEEHLKECSSCRIESESIKHLNSGFNSLQNIRTPQGLRRKTVRAFQNEIIRPGLREWWQNLSFSMRSAVCGVVLTGMLCGAVLCNSMVTKEASQPADPYQTLYAYKGVF